MISQQLMMIEIGTSQQTCSLISRKLMGYQSTQTCYSAYDYYLHLNFNHLVGFFINFLTCPGTVYGANDDGLGIGVICTRLAADLWDGVSDRY